VEVEAMAWALLVVAGLLEVVWAVGLRYTEGFTRFWASVGTLLTMGASFYLLATALRTIPVGTGYAVWTGIGAIGAALFGMAFLGEPRAAGRLLGIGMIVGGIALLRAA
jgi:quaternary ammonium compound-resistance protein SugE